MTADTLLERITDYGNRPDPYPLYAELREAGPVVRQSDGSYLIGTYHEVAALLHDPRISADPRSRTAPSPGPSQDAPKPPFLRLDDPEHHRLRTLAMRPFGPPHTPGRIDAMRGEITRITEEVLGSLGPGGRSTSWTISPTRCPSRSSAGCSACRARTSPCSAGGPTR